jgi:hypothetical protein
MIPDSILQASGFFYGPSGLGIGGYRRGKLFRASLAQKAGF